MKFQNKFIMNFPKVKANEKFSKTIVKALLLREELWFWLTAEYSEEIIKGLDNGNEKINRQGMIKVNILYKKEGKIYI